MSIVISVKDSLYNEGDRYDYSVETVIDPVNYMGNVRFEDIRIEGNYFATGDNVRFYGKINLRCIYECDRCLTEFSREHNCSFSETFSSSSDDETLLISRNFTVDLQPLVYDSIITSLPIERLCKEDCKGLCPHCGIDKNFSSCSCDEGDDDNPFSVLRGLVD